MKAVTMVERLRRGPLLLLQMPEEHDPTYVAILQSRIGPIAILTPKGGALLGIRTTGYSEESLMMLALAHELEERQPNWHIRLFSNRRSFEVRCEDKRVVVGYWGGCRRRQVPVILLGKDVPLQVGCLEALEGALSVQLQAQGATSTDRRL